MSRLAFNRVSHQQPPLGGVSWASQGGGPPLPLLVEGGTCCTQVLALATQTDPGGGGLAASQPCWELRSQE